MPDGVPIQHSDGLVRDNTRSNFLTFAQLIERVLQDPTLEMEERRRIASAIRKTCNDLQIDAATAPATSSFLRKALAGMTHHRLGVARKTLQNRKASILSAIARYATTGDVRGRAGLDPTWATLYSILPEGDLRWGLTRLLRYLSEQGIEPRAVTDQIVEPFLDWLTHRTSVRKPAQLHRRCLVLWNKAARSIPRWPSFIFSIPNRDVGYVIEWGALHPDLRAEVEVWLAAQANPDPFNFDRPPHPAAPESLKAWRFQIRQAVSAAGLQGIDSDTIRSLSHLIEPDTCERILRFFWERFGAKKNQTTAAIAATFLKIGRYWCKVDDQRLRQLTAIKKNLRIDRRGMRAGVRERLAQFKDKYNVEQLLMLPVRIAERFRRLKHVSVADALELQIAAAIELLLMCPLRRRNLVKLRLGRDGHFRFNHDGRGATYIIIPGSEVKNKEPIDAPIPRETADLLRTYLERARPVLSKAPGDWLFPGEVANTHKSLDHFSRLYTKVINRLTGLKVNLHLMRQIGALLYLNRHPGQYEVIRRVLAHRSLSTTVNSYTGVEMDAALRLYDAVILGIRNGILVEVGDGAN